MAPPILHLGKTLVRRPAIVDIAGVEVRPMAVPHDVPAWLALRRRAVAGLTPQPRPWSHEDFCTEMVEKPWWPTAWNWLAVAPASPASAHTASPDAGVIGAVTLALRTGADRRWPVVHWLLVDPAWRRRGVARGLISHLEQAAWDAGHRQVRLETHAGWTAAVACYRSLGYRN